MVRLNIIVEGETEEEFVNQILAHHLGYYDIYTSVHRITTNRSNKRKQRGGLTNYLHIKNDIESWSKQDSKYKDVRFTTMLDLYALPNEFPKFEQAKKLLDPYDKVEFLEAEFANDINDYRFIPYIQLHEFEALIFTDLEEIYKSFPEYNQYQKAINLLLLECSNFSSPELINQGATTAPSKRLAQVIPNYNKLKIPLASLILEKIGLAKIREKCPHFNQWITQLENLQI
jgi:hypothetical protein